MPATPSSAFGTSTPCQWIVTPSSMSSLIKVASTSSPWRTRSSGPGSCPLKVQASMTRPEASATSAVLATKVTRYVALPCGPLSWATLTCGCPEWFCTGPRPYSTGPNSRAEYVAGSRLSYQALPSQPAAASASTVTRPMTVRTSMGFTLDQRQLAMGLEAGQTDADEAERTGSVGQRPVEQRTGELPDSVGIVGADGQRRRAAPDREVR